MVTAKYGSKEFQVSQKQIYTPDGLTISEAIELEEKEVSGKKPNTSVKSIKLQDLKFEVRLDARFVSVDSELRWWKSKLLGKASDFFYLGGFKIGKFYLTQYDVKEIRTDKKGEYLSAVISLGFTEDGTYANNKTINFESTAKANAVKASADSSKKKEIKVGTYVKPKSGTRWYYTAEGALKKTGKSGKAWNQNLKVSYIYKSGKAINPQGLGWMLPEDVDVVSGASGGTTSTSSSSKKKITGGRR